MTQSVAAEMPKPTAARRSVPLDAQGEAHLREAMALMGIDDPAEVVRAALEELVERQRFLALVAKHEKAHRGLA